VSGTVQHIKSPTGHGDGAGLPFPFTMSINAGGPLNDALAPPPKIHGVHIEGDHTDTMTGALGDVAFGLIFHEFSSYSFNIDLRHCSSPCPVGEPLQTPITLEQVPEPAGDLHVVRCSRPRLWLETEETSVVRGPAEQLVLPGSSSCAASGGCSGPSESTDAFLAAKDHMGRGSVVTR